tara:strand:- start:16124 stop:16336 length:213 start_codon:yes stop_codon:yes gene_type:complete
MQKKLFICHIIYILIIVLILIYINKYYNCDCKKEEFKIVVNENNIKKLIDNGSSMVDMAKKLTNELKVTE